MTRSHPPVIQKRLYSSNLSKQYGGSVKNARIGLLVLSMIMVLSACSSGSKPQELRSLTVTPLSGPPGTVLTITGLQPTPEQMDNLELWVGDQPAPVIVNEDGSLSTAIPLFLGPDNWPEPPAEPQTVEVRRSGQVLGISADGVTVAELPRAPGTTQEVQTALAQIATAYEDLLAMIPVASEEETLFREAVMAMFNGLVSDGENSLQAVLNGTAPMLEGMAVDTELIDAVLASSGAAAYLHEYANAFQGTTQAQLETQALAGLCDGEGADVELACKMQIYVVLNDYNETFVKPTAETYANTVGLALGVIAISGITVPVDVIISAILSTAEFVMSKAVPSLLPSKLSQFDLQISNTSIDIGELTNSKIMVVATNQPPKIGALEVVEQIMTLTGLKDLKGELADTFTDVLKNTIEFTLGLFKEMFGGVLPDIEQQIPPMQWGPVEVTDPRLVQLFSSDSSIVAPLEEELEWKGIALGEATARVTPRGPGEKSKILRDRALCLFCIYYGGAFGTEMPSSEKKVIVGDLILTATPDTGKAPLNVTFSWSGLEPQEEPYTCILEVGDGSTMYSIPDCANTTSKTHTYPYTSALETESGKYLATLKVVGAEKSAATEVLVDWVFTATPTQGQAPLDANFNWGGFDPEGGAISCTLDFGDGSAVQTFSNCHSTKTATHQYTSKGSYVPSLTITGVSGQTVKTAQVTVGQQLCPPDPDTSQRCIGEAQYVQTERWYSGATTNDARDTWTFSNIEFVYDEVNSTASASYFYVAKATLVNYERWHKTYDQINGETCETYETASSIPLVNLNDSIEYAIQDTPVGGWLVVLHEEADGFPAGSYAGTAGAMFEAKYERTCTDASRNVTKQVTGGAEMFLIPGPENYGPGDPPEPHMIQEGGVLAGSYTFGGDDGFGGSSSGELSWHFVIPDLH
jgi:PKD repeat protein